MDEELPALVVERLLIERTAEQDLTPPGSLNCVFAVLHSLTLGSIANHQYAGDSEGRYKLRENI